MTDTEKKELRLAVAQLRSGEYTQARSVLRRSSGYCCLGVFTEEFRKATGRGTWEGPNYEGEFVFILDDKTHKLYMPNEVFEWLGLDFSVYPNAGDIKTPFHRLRDPDPEDGVRYEDTTAWTGAADMNDSGFTFEQIADVLEYIWGLNAEPVAA